MSLCALLLSLQCWGDTVMGILLAALLRRRAKIGSAFLIGLPEDGGPRFYFAHRNHYLVLYLTTCLCLANETVVELKT